MTAKHNMTARFLDTKDNCKRKTLSDRDNLSERVSEKLRKHAANKGLDYTPKRRRRNRRKNQSNSVF